jgi:hypothetical protein
MILRSQILPQDFLREVERFFAVFFLVDPPLRGEAFFAEVFFFGVLFLRGTFPPSLRASDKPMAMACLRLVTFLPERPDFSVPLFFSCIAFSTLLDAFFP